MFESQGQAQRMIICRLYPDGGGVYASVRHRSEVISIVGAFLLIADYLVTAAISALSAFQYLGVPHPEKFAAVAILLVGLLNLLGPKQTGGLAFLVSIPTALVVITLGLVSLPHLGQAFAHLQPLHAKASPKNGLWCDSPLGRYFSAAEAFPRYAVAQPCPRKVPSPL